MIKNCDFNVVLGYFGRVISLRINRSTGDAERLDEILNENEGFDLNIQDQVSYFEHLLRIILWVVSSFLSFFTAGWG